MRLKVAAVLIAAPLALASRPLGHDWLFYPAVVALIVALALPTRSGQTIGKRLELLMRHLPGMGWLVRRPDEMREEED